MSFSAPGNAVPAAELVSIRALEEIGAAQWPAETVRWLHGWRLGFTHGVTRRANSVLPSRWDDEADLDRAVVAAEARYRSCGLDPCFKITAGSLPAPLDDRLAARGYAREGHSHVLTAPLADLDARAATAGDVRLYDAPTLAWLSATGWPEAESAVRTRLVERIPRPRAFAAALHDGEVASVGLAARQDSWAGIYALHTQPDLRGRGYARSVIGTLLGWAVGEGAGAAYLPVEVDNPAAIGLYRSVGFADTYDYYYRTLRPMRDGVRASRLSL